MIDGYKLAQSLGVQAFHMETGAQGCVYFLEDGRIMKICQRDEAALAAAVLETQFHHPGVPRIDAVFQVLNEIEIDTTLGAKTFPMQTYCIIRESFDDVFFECEKEQCLNTWEIAVWRLADQWEAATPQNLNECRDEHVSIRQIGEGLFALKEAFDIRVVDIRPSNIGVSREGYFGMRDLGRFYGEPEALERLHKRLADIKVIDPARFDEMIAAHEDHTLACHCI